MLKGRLLECADVRACKPIHACMASEVDGQPPNKCGVLLNAVNAGRQRQTMYKPRTHSAVYALPWF